MSEPNGFLEILADRLLDMFEHDEELKAAAIDLITSRAKHERAMAKHKEALAEKHGRSL